MTHAASGRNRFTRMLTLRGYLAFALAVVVLAVWAAVPLGEIHAHAYLDELRSNPTPESVNEVPPEKVRLWFTEPIDPDQSSIQVFDESGQQVDAGDARVDSGDPHQMVVSLEQIPDGTYSVSWSALSTVDGHPSQGSFSFQVGQGRLPGAAATTEGERPPVDDVVLRWLTIGSLTLVAGWFLLHAFRIDISVTNRVLIVVGGTVALLSDLYQVLQQAIGSQQGSLGGVLQITREMPADWYVRVPLEAVLLSLAILILRRKTAGSLRWAGLVISVLPVASLSYTTHAATEQHQAFALPVNALHLVSVALWLGGLVHLALASATGDGIDRATLSGFSRFAAIAAPVALLTGFVNAGLLLPTVESVWTSAYGQTLLLKLVLIAGALALAWYNRRRLWSSVIQIGKLFRTVRTEALFGTGVILVASFMALSALPTPEEQEPLHLRISVQEDRFGYFFMENPDTGEQDVSLWLGNDEGEPSSDVEDVQVEFSMLESNRDVEVEAEVQQNGRWLIPDLNFETEGWWRARVDFETGGETTTTEFVYLLPDPTLVGDDFNRSTEQTAVDLYQNALNQLLGLDSMQTVENLGDGAGNGVRTEYDYLAPDRMRYVTSSGNESIAIGGDQYLLKDGESEWMLRERVRPYSFPDVFSFFYSGARDVTLGREVTENGATYQLVSFYVPDVTGRAEAWYLWFVDTETGMLRREAMIATHHYMDNRFGSFNQQLEIEPPDEGSIAEDDDEANS